MKTLSVLTVMIVTSVPLQAGINKMSNWFWQTAIELICCSKCVDLSKH